MKNYSSNNMEETPSILASVLSAVSNGMFISRDVAAMMASGIFTFLSCLMAMVLWLIASGKPIFTTPSKASLTIASCFDEIPGTPSNSISVIKEIYNNLPSRTPAAFLLPSSREMNTFVSTKYLSLPLISCALLIFERVAINTFQLSDKFVRGEPFGLFSLTRGSRSSAFHLALDLRGRVGFADDDSHDVKIDWNSKITGFFQIDDEQVVSSLPPVVDDLEKEMEEGLSTFQQDESLTIINYHKGSSKNCQFPLLLWRRKG